MTSVFCKWIAPFILLAVYASLSLATAFQTSATWDETHYLGLGRYILEKGQWDLPSATLHPPLSYYIHSLPLFFCNLDQSCFEQGPGSDILSGVLRGQCLMRSSNPGGDMLLFLARMPMIGIGIFLGWLVYLWASRLYGSGGGLLSLFLYCLSPNILAHSGLITTDLSLSAFGFATAYFFWRNTCSPSISRIVLSGFTLGLTLSSKHAGLLWVPILACFSMGERILFRRYRESMRGFLGSGPIIHFSVVALLGFTLLYLGYQADLSSYLSGMEEQKRIVGEGFPGFLNEEVSRVGGWWYYYLIAFMLKVPVPSLILILASLFLTTRIRDYNDQSSILWLIAPVFFIFAFFSFMSQVNVGLRYVLPAFPFLFVLAGRTAVFIRKIGRSSVAVVFISLLAWYAVENGSIFPHYLAYFNQFAGGPKNGYHYLVDSNLDWGQSLKTLRRYMDQTGTKTIKLSYFGSVDPKQYGIKYEDIGSFPGLDRSSTPISLKKGDLVAVSATNLYPLYIDLGGLAEHLRSLQPVAYLGYSILVYRLKKDFQIVHLPRDKVEWRIVDTPV